MKLKGSTLIEVIVAMVVITIIMAMVSMIFIEVVSGPGLRLRLEAEAMLSEISVKARAEKSMVKREMKIRDFTIVQSLEPAPGSDKVYKLNLQVRDLHERILAERREWILLIP